MQYIYKMLVMSCYNIKNSYLYYPVKIKVQYYEMSMILNATYESFYYWISNFSKAIKWQGLKIKVLLSFWWPY